MRLLVSFLLMTACSAPSPHFRGVPPTRVSVDGSTFDVRQKGRLAEATRLNAEYAPRLGAIAERAAHAIQLVTDCTVLELRGDAAQVLGILDCSTEPKRPIPYRRAQDCDVVDAFTPSGSDVTYLEAEC